MKKYCFIIFLTCIFSQPLKAKENDVINSLSGTKDNFGEQIYSLSKKNERAFDTASAVYVLSSEDIRRSGATSVPEALRLVPGVQVAKMNGSVYAVSIRGFNRQFANKLLVMIDGRTVYTTLFSGVAWNFHDYVMEDIDRIEVIRGPGGTIWGSNAVNGVINIITKNSVQTKGAYVSQILGDQDKSITEIRYGGTTKNDDDYRLYVKKAVRDGLDRYDTKTSNHDGNTQDRAGFRYDKKPSPSIGNLSISGDIFDVVASNFFSSVSNYGVINTNQDSKGGNIATNWEKKTSKHSSLLLNSYFIYDQFSTGIFSRSSKTFDIDFQHFYNFIGGNQFVWGLSYRQIEDDIKHTAISNGVTLLDYSNPHRNDQWFTGFVQQKFELSKDLSLTFGSKFEKNDFNGFSYQPNAKITYFPSKKQTLWASISKAVRTPTRGESDLTLSAANGFVIAKGNSNYETEEVVAYELGYRIKPSYSTLIDATTFYNEYRKLRTFEGVNGYASNLGYGQSYGFEILGKWFATSDFRLEASYDFLEMNLGTSSASTDANNINGLYDSLQMTEGQAPQSQVKIKSYYNIAPKLEFDNVMYYVSGLPQASGGTNGSRGIPSYFRFDTRLGYLYSKNLDLSVGVQNLLDQRHREFKQALYSNVTEVGRTFYAKLVWRY